jgi:tetratricopeptide (TPR) repeat protein
MVLCAGGLLVAGCRRPIAAADAHERSGPEFERAVALEQVGRLDDAIDLYEQILFDHPRKIVAHLHLALLLHDHRHDYISAIYHYKRYISLRPGGEKDETVTRRIRLAEQLLGAQFGRRSDINTGANQKEMAAEIDKLNGRITALEGEKRTLVDERDKLGNELKESQAEAQRLRRLVDKLQMVATDDAGAGKPRGSVLSRMRTRREGVEEASSKSAKLPPLGSDAIAAARAEAERLAAGDDSVVEVPAAGGRGSDKGGARAANTAKTVTYVVQPGDTLFRIAERHYGDGNAWKRIRDANRKQINLDGQVRVGQVLVIP